VTKIFFRAMTAFFLVAALSACSSVGVDSPAPGQADKLRQTARTPQRAANVALQSPSGDEESAAEKLPYVSAVAENSVYFPSSRASIDERGTALLRQHAAQLKENSRLVVTLVAYTDNLGSRSYNLAIAEQRMDAVAEALHALGVPMRQIRRENAGSSKTSATCNTAVCRQQMRRVELMYE